jgi:hypothetical protein
MKKLALLITLALFALTVPASAAETSQAAPAAPAAQVMTPEHQVDAPLPLLERIVKPLTPFCSAVHGTCSPTGSTTPCTDACGDHLSCTCQSSHTWFCQQEC